jgi:outer membrane protein OmpA-like peptidoglycan-associated protein
MHGYVSHFARALTWVLLVGGAVARSMAIEVPPDSRLSMADADLLRAGDVPGSHDSPIVSRFAGSTIAAYQEVNYDEVALPMGPRGNSGFAKTLATKGKVTRIVYASPSGKTPGEVFANFRDSLQQSGFKLLYSCTTGTSSETACGGYPFAQDYTHEMIQQQDSARASLIMSLLHSETSDVRYLLAELQRGGRRVDVGLMVAQNAGPTPGGVMLQVIESGQMPSGEVTVDSAAITHGLESEGKFALYGLQFATDSADLRPDSDATLKQMSDVLHQQPGLKVFIVGHTDNSGSLEHNLALSQRRAQSVVKALTSRFGIAPNRLVAVGMASYSPVASNHSDAGKAKNRRVEMVEQ